MAFLDQDTPKYYFGWYKLHGKILCELWDSDIGSCNNCPVKILITQEEWQAPLVDLENKYAYLKHDLL